MIAMRMKHPPQVKFLVDELYVRLFATGRAHYEHAVADEYCTVGQKISHNVLGDGLVSVVLTPVAAGTPARITHLIYGGCTADQVRRDLISRGLGSLPITRVYPWSTLLTG